MLVIDIPYRVDSRYLFEAIRHLPFACWLDSGKPYSQSGRYDILSAAPDKRWVTFGDKTSIYEKSADFCYEEVESSQKDPFGLIDNALSSPTTSSLTAPSLTASNTLPFTGGLIGYFAYDLDFEQRPCQHTESPECQLPDMVMGFYSWAIIQDHQEQSAYLCAMETCSPAFIDKIQALINSSAETPDTPFQLEPLTAHLGHRDYQQQFQKIIDYIYAGDCYQVNFAQCFSGRYQGDPYQAYRLLRQTMASPFSAYLDLGSIPSKQQSVNPQAILSLSPERFLQINGNQVLTQPIKGTIARGEDAVTDKENAEQLRNSEKNCAENVMIVDLLRNDLGKNCLPGSVEVPELLALKSFPNVHHLVSSVTGKTQPGISHVDIFQGCFPGGSITGAPKKRAMEIIQELENTPRSVYCGSVAYFSTNGQSDSNITIRTLAADGEKLYCWGGGGIVVDSDGEEEYQESKTKINAILSTLDRFSSV